jgi:hypothetical protein
VSRPPTAAFPLETIKWLAFAMSVEALYVSAYIAYSYRKDVASSVTALLTGGERLDDRRLTGQNLALASVLALSGLALAAA